MQTRPYGIFNMDVTMSGSESSDLENDYNAHDALTRACAVVIQQQSNTVEYETTAVIVARRKLFGFLEKFIQRILQTTYTIEVTTKVTIPLVDLVPTTGNDATYDEINDAVLVIGVLASEAVDDGSFTILLQQNAISADATSLSSAMVVSAVISSATTVLLAPTFRPTPAPTPSAWTSDTYIILYAVAAVVLILSIIGAYYFRRWHNKVYPPPPKVELFHGGASSTGTELDQIAANRGSSAAHSNSVALFSSGGAHRTVALDGDHATNLFTKGAAFLSPPKSYRLEQSTREVEAAKDGLAGFARSRMDEELVIEDFGEMPIGALV